MADNVILNRSGVHSVEKFHREGNLWINRLNLNIIFKYLKTIMYNIHTYNTLVRTKLAGISAVLNDKITGNSQNNYKKFKENKDMRRGIK